MKLRSVVSALLLAGSGLTLAQVPSAYSYNLIIRADTDGGLPSNAINSATVSINNSGDIAFKALVGGDFGVWRGNASGGTFISTPFESMADPYLHNNGMVLFTTASFGDEGIYTIAPGAGTFSLLTDGPPGASSYSNARMTDSGLIGYRTNASSSLGRLVLHDPVGGSFTTVATAGGGISFLYSAAKVNAGGVFGTKVDLASNAQQEMRRYRANGTFDILAQNQGVNAGSPYVNFFNNIGWGDNNALAFNANLGPGNRGVFWTDGTTTRTIATSLTSNARPTESFDMGVLGNVVYFRGFDSLNRHAIWVGDGTNLRRVVTEGDLITTAEGIFRIGNGFHGSPSINSLGQVAFAVTLFDPLTNAPRGIGAITATPVPEPATLAVLGLGALAMLQRNRKA